MLRPVRHLPWVLTTPERLRLFFLEERTLLGDLARSTRSTVRDLYRAGPRDHASVPGMVFSIQTHGDLANRQPHLHALVTAGLFDRDGSFTPVDPPPTAVAGIEFPVLRMACMARAFRERQPKRFLFGENQPIDVRFEIV